MTVVKYIADGFLHDVNQLFAEFTERNSLDFSDFAEVWRKRNFSLIYMGRENLKELGEFTQEIFCLSAKFLLSDSLVVQVGGTYLLYALHRNQISSRQIRIRILLPQFLTLQLLLEKAVTEKLYSLHYVLDYLFEKCFDLVAVRTLMGPNGRRVGSRSKRYCVAMDTDYRSNLIELKKSNLLQELKESFEKYAKIRPSRTWSEASNRFTQLVGVFDKFVTDELEESLTKSPAVSKAGPSRRFKYECSRKPRVNNSHPRSSVKSQTAKPRTGAVRKKRFEISYEETDTVTPKLFLPKPVRTKTRRIRRYYKEPPPQESKSESSDTSSSDCDGELPSLCPDETSQKRNSNVGKRLKSNSHVRMCSRKSQICDSDDIMCPTEISQNSKFRNEKILNRKPESSHPIYPFKISQISESKDVINVKYPFEISRKHDTNGENRLIQPVDNFPENNSQVQICLRDSQILDSDNKASPTEISSESDFLDEIYPFKVSQKPKSDEKIYSDEISQKPESDGIYSTEVSQKPESDGICSTEKFPTEVLQKCDFDDEIYPFKIPQKLASAQISSTEISQELESDRIYSTEISQEPLSDRIYSTEISQEPQSDGIYSTEISQEPLSDRIYSTEISQKPESFEMIAMKNPFEVSLESDSYGEMCSRDLLKSDSDDVICLDEISPKKDSDDENSESDEVYSIESNEVIYL